MKKILFTLAIIATHLPSVILIEIIEMHSNHLLRLRSEQSAFKRV